MTLSLKKSQALTVIHMSEGRPGPSGDDEGHTKEKHVNISKDELSERMSKPTPKGGRDAVHWMSAFIDIHDCAEMLTKAISTLSADEFVRNFANMEDGKHFQRTNIMVGEFDCRDHRGRARASHVYLSMMKHNDRPHKLHLITFYPVIPLMLED